MGSVSQNFVFLPDGVYTIIFKGSSGSKSDSFSRKDVRLSRLEVIGDWCPPFTASGHFPSTSWDRLQYPWPFGLRMWCRFKTFQWQRGERLRERYRSWWRRWRRRCSRNWLCQCVASQTSPHWEDGWSSKDLNSVVHHPQNYANYGFVVHEEETGGACITWRVDTHQLPAKIDERQYPWCYSSTSGASKRERW